jgi:hypothetical protein
VQGGLLFGVVVVAAASWVVDGAAVELLVVVVAASSVLSLEHAPRVRAVIATRLVPSTASRMSGDFFMSFFMAIP